MQHSVKSFIHNLRLYKSPFEVSAMRATCEVASAAFITTMHCTKPGDTERELGTWIIVSRH